jgi:hypothetical protein
VTGKFATETDPALFAQFRSAVEASPTYQVLKGRQSEKTFQLTKPSGMVINYDIDRKFLKYVLGDDEVWARAYSQYIAVRSGDDVMMAEIAKWRTMNSHQVYPLQWTDDEFEPIAAAIDKLFEGLGWRQ